MAEREEPQSPRPSGDAPDEPSLTPAEEEHDRRLMSRVAEMLGERRHRRRRFRRDDEEDAERE